MEHRNMFETRSLFSRKTFLIDLVAVFILILLTSLFFSLQAHAAEGTGWRLNPKFMYLIENTTVSGSTTNTNRVLADLGLGYKFNGPVYLGAQYGYDNKTTSGASSGAQTYQGFGPTFGLMADSAYLLFTYYISDSHTDQQGNSTTTYGGGSGYQLDFAYLFGVGGSWSVGPCLSFRSLHYTTISPGGSTDFTYTTLLPYVSFVIAL